MKSPFGAIGATADTNVTPPQVEEYLFGVE